MKYTIKDYSPGIYIWNKHLWYVGEKVKVDVDGLAEQYRKDKCFLINEESYKYLESIRDKEFEIEWLPMYPAFGDVPGVVIKNFPHILDLKDLIIIK